jgi:DNA gyrase subunit A
MDQRAADRLHIIEGLLTALENLAQVNQVVGESEDRVAATAALAAALDLSEVQVDHVLDMTIARQTRLGRAELQSEADFLRSE